MLGPMGDEADAGVVTVVRRLPARGAVARSLVRAADQPRELWVIPPAERARWDEAVDALGAVSTPHVRSPIDLAVRPSGALVVVWPVFPAQTAQELLRERGWITPGRVVTLVYPIAESLHELHRGGVTLGSVCVDQIGIDASGMPILAESETARRSPSLPAEWRERDPHYAADRSQFAELCAQLRDRLRSAGWRDAAESLPDASTLLADPDALTRWSAAEPLRGQSRASEAPMTPPLSAASAGGVPPQVAGAAGTNVDTGDGVAAERRAEGVLVRVSRQLGLPGELRTALAESASGLALRVTRLRRALTALSPRRLAAFAALASVVVAVVVSTALSGGDGEPQEAAVSSRDSPDTNAEPPASAADDPTAVADPDDWALVVENLISRWRQCTHDARVICDEAVHAGAPLSSPGASGFGDTIGAVETALSDPAGEFALVERSGDVAVVVASVPEMAPASLLLMRSEAGWRIRDAWR